MASAMKKERLLRNRKEFYNLEENRKVEEDIWNSISK